MPVCAITIAADRKLVVEMVLALWKNARVLPGIHPYLQRYVKQHRLRDNLACSILVAFASLRTLNPSSNTNIKICRS